MPEAAVALALKALARKEQTEAELTGWLGARGVSAEEIDSTIAALKRSGAVDDARFARRFAEDKRELAGWGSDRIRSTLIGRGVAPAQVEAALAEGAEGELSRAVSLLRRRSVPLGDDRERGRAFALLARRGYDAELAYAAIHEAAAPTQRS